MNTGAGKADELWGVQIGVLIAGVVAFGPLAMALFLCRLSGDRMSWRWPFQSEHLVGALGISLSVALLCCALPIYKVIRLAA